MHQGESVKVVVLPQAAAKVGHVIRPFLERSYATYLQNARRDVVSEYLGRTLIVVTVQTNVETIQIALMREEICNLPPDDQAHLNRLLATPAEASTFTVILPAVNYAVTSGHHLSIEDGQHRMGRPLEKSRE